ncbi:hypothetical protein C8R44DRAFT_984212 [Mycena epipterygia]|nr:hypothetical protein C8R44DRAFT_984212 [Mycena epipterygia]
MPTPYSPALDGSLGALEIGTVVGTFFFGILTLQTFNYFRQFPEDSKTLKTVVAVIWSLELAHTICALQGIYVITVTYYGQPPDEVILNPPQAHILTILFSGGIDATVQIFFGNRIRAFSGRSYVFFLCIVLGIVRFACDIVLMANFWIYNAGYALVDSNEHWEVLTAETVSPAGDVLIALSMCYCLWQVRKSEFNRTRGMVDTLIIWTFETAIITSGAGIIQLILFLTRKDLSFVAVFLIQPKLFSNAMLASLNGRTRFRGTESTTLANSGSGSLAFESAAARSRCEGDHRIMSDASELRNSVVVHISPTPDDISLKDKTEEVV